MRPPTFAFTLAALCAIVLLPKIGENSFAQSANSTTPQTDVVITNLANPIYPPLARQVNVYGDVKVSLGIRLDGTVESAVVISGHPLLGQAALDSAQHSQYECRSCTEPVTSFSLFYTFQLEGEGCAPNVKAPASGSLQEAKPISPEIRPQNHLLVAVQRICISCPGPDSKKVRSARCLYLWKCRSLPRA